MNAIELTIKVSDMSFSFPFSFTEVFSIFGMLVSTYILLALTAYKVGYKFGHIRGLQEGEEVGYKKGRPRKFDKLACVHYPAEMDNNLYYDIEMLKKDGRVIEVSCPYIKQNNCINTGSRCILLDPVSS